MPVKIICCSNTGHYDVAGSMVKEVAVRLRDVLNVSPLATASVKGQPVSADYVLQDGDHLEFVVRAGEKGGLHDLWSEKELIEFLGRKQIDAMRKAGLAFTLQPALTRDEVISWMKWSADKSHDPANTINIGVDVENEQMTFRGKTYPLIRQLALALKCIVDAEGEIRSTGDMRRAYPNEPWEKRLDQTIKRKLLKHCSGVGDVIESVDKKGYRLKLAKA
jgi:hypothetical protein